MAAAIIDSAMRIAASALLLWMSASPLAQSSAPVPTSTWWSDYSAHARQVRIGPARTLHLLCEGQGSPTIILESGTGDGMTVWRKVQPALAQHNRVCAYDRAGLGLSSPDLRHRDLYGIVSDLEKLTTRAHLPAPYVLVSHSFGGMAVRLYARRHPSNVTGMMLVDPPVESQTQRISKIMPGIEKMMAQQIDHSRDCAAKKILSGDCQPDIPDDAPPAVAARLRANARLNYLTQAAELEAAINGADDAELVRAGTDLGNVPLVVLTSEQFKTNQHMPPELRMSAQNLWMTFHDEIAAHSKRGSNRVVAGTGHYIQLERPDAVITAVEEVAGAASHR
jgi:pimeloyl-ACP methyl ester carboxylesterase